MKRLRGCDINLLDTANNYYEAYKRCIRGEKIDDKIYFVAIPAFSNGFFACELYLKHILANNGINIKGHALMILFKHLPKDMQTWLENMYFKNESEFLASYDIKFNDLLEAVSGGFEFWRFIYEDDNKPFEPNHPFAYSEKFLEGFLPLLYQVANIKTRNLQS